jgi:hypothetical protein
VRVPRPATAPGLYSQEDDGDSTLDNGPKHLAKSRSDHAHNHTHGANGMREGSTLELNCSAQPAKLCILATCTDQSRSILPVPLPQHRAILVRIFPPVNQQCLRVTRASAQKRFAE